MTTCIKYLNFSPRILNKTVPKSYYKNPCVKVSFVSRVVMKNVKFQF